MLTTAPYPIAICANFASDGSGISRGTRGGCGLVGLEVAEVKREICHECCH